MQLDAFQTNVGIQPSREFKGHQQCHSSSQEIYKAFLKDC